MSNQGTIRLKVTNSAPAIEKLWNNRYKLEFFCDNNSPKEDWYYENVSALLPEYGILQTTNFGSGVSEDWEAIPDSVYPDMRLVLAEYPYNVRAGKHYVKLTYETLTASWVEEKDEDTDYELNGLKRVSRTFVALPGTEYDKVIGTSTIDSNGTTLYLGSFKVEETDAKWSLSESWFEAGELSREENSEDAKGSISITQIGGCPAAPAGYTVVNESKNNTQGFETCSRTFYKNDSELSRSNDYVGSQLAESIEVFSPTVAPTPTIGTAVLGNKSTSNVDGIPTTRYTFLVPSVLSESSDKVGSQLAITVEAFNETPATPTGYVIASEQASDVDGIPTKRFTFLKDEAELSRSIQTKNNGKLIIEVVEVFNGTPVADTIGAVKIGDEVSNVDGIPTRRFTFAKGAGQISVDRKPASTQLAGCTYVTVRSLGTPVTPGGVLVSESETESDGFVTYEKTALQGTITGVKQTYTDVADVEVPGEVDCTTENISIADGVIGNITGTIAIPKVQPRRSKKIAATVTVEITSSPPSTASLAYDLGQISCSVTSVSKNYTSRNGPTNYVKVGIFKNPYTDWQRSYTPSARIQVYPGCFLTTASSNGSVGYKSQKTYVFEADNDGDGYYDGIDSTIESNASSTTSCIGQGSTSNAGYVTTGILRRDSRPVLTSLDGTTYYEVITWSV